MHLKELYLPFIKLKVMLQTPNKTVLLQIATNAGDLRKRQNDKNNVCMPAEILS
jgi:hypothetical protein